MRIFRNLCCPSQKVEPKKNRDTESSNISYISRDSKTTIQKEKEFSFMTEYYQSDINSYFRKSLGNDTEKRIWLDTNYKN